MNLELNKKEFSALSNFFSLSDCYPYDNWSKENIVEYAIQESFEIFEEDQKNKLVGYQITRELFYLIQKFVRIYPFENPPLYKDEVVGWAEYICNKVSVCKKTDQEAYDWICDIFKIYARKLKERNVITEDEEQRLFEGDIIELKEEDKYFLASK